MAALKRCFLALTPDDIAVADLGDLMDGISIDGLRRTVPQSLHVTIKFLGDIDDTKVTQIIQSLSSSIEGIGPLEIEMVGLDYLPSQHRPRALAASVQMTAPLQALAERVENIAAELGFQKEARAFYPHITLGRFNKSRSPQAPDLDTLGPVETGFTATGLSLIESFLEPAGPSYVELANFSL
jgi:2'-5' RNA ligase